MILEKIFNKHRSKDQKYLKKMIFSKRLFSRDKAKKENSNVSESKLAQTKKLSPFMPAKEYSKYFQKGILSRYYREGMNCFLDSIGDADLRQAAFEELLMKTPEYLQRLEYETDVQYARK